MCFLSVIYHNITSRTNKIIGVFYELPSPDKTIKELHNFSLDRL